MGVNNFQIIILISLGIVLLFIFSNCKVACKSPKEGFYDQIRDQVSDPYFSDDCSHGNGCQLYNYHMPAGWAKGMPLTARGKPCPKTSYDILRDTSCPECATQVMRFM